MNTLRVELHELRIAGALMLGAGTVRGLFHSHIGLPCPLRSLTGIPCPMCGMTTSVTAATHADVVGALSANPAGLLAVIAAIALLIIPTKTSLDLPRWVLPAGLVFMWVWELVRFHLI